MITIRPEQPDDAAQVRRVNELAFEQPAEADLVERLRPACADSLSLVAEDKGVVGHIFFTPVVVESAARPVLGMGLAPMAVLPDRQRQGIGSQLVTRGLDILRERSCPFVVVVGHPESYAFRVRACIHARPLESMEGHAGCGVHGPRPEPPRHGGSIRCGDLPR